MTKLTNWLKKRWMSDLLWYVAEEVVFLAGVAVLMVMLVTNWAPTPLVVGAGIATLSGSEALRNLLRELGQRWRSRR